MNKLPEGWASTSLGELATWGSGGTPSRNQPHFYQGHIPWIKSGELNSRYVTETEEKISEAALNSSSAKIFPAGSVAIAMYGATIGKTAILGIRAATNQACAVGTPTEGLIQPEFLHRLLQSEKKFFIEKGKGGAQPNISQAVIKSHEVNIPPFLEQSRIVHALEGLLAQVDTLKARLDALPAMIKRFRQSVLSDAVSGRLTENWRSRPIESYDIRSLGALVAEPLRNGKSVKDGSGQRVLRLSALKSRGIDFNESKAGEWEGINIERYLVQTGDILVSRGNGSKDLVGRGGLIGLVPGKMAYPDTMIRIRPQTESLTPDYLTAIWNSQLVRGQIESAARTTAGIWKISQGDLESLQLPVPDIDEQAEISGRVEQLFTFADQLEARLADARQRVDALTQSILAKAFRGELVPQDPNDEPASVLLERIAAQRAADPKPKRGRKAAAH